MRAPRVSRRALVPLSRGSTRHGAQLVGVGRRHVEGRGGAAAVEHRGAPGVGYLALRQHGAHLAGDRQSVDGDCGERDSGMWSGADRAEAPIAGRERAAPVPTPDMRNISSTAPGRRPRSGASAGTHLPRCKKGAQKARTLREPTPRTTDWKVRGGRGGDFLNPLQREAETLPDPTPLCSTVIRQRAARRTEGEWEASGVGGGARTVAHLRSRSKPRMKSNGGFNKSILFLVPEGRDTFVIYPDRSSSRRHNLFDPFGSNLQRVPFAAPSTEGGAFHQRDKAPANAGNEREERRRRRRRQASA